jgi:diguanylate cyclase (GGDEF)-like protein/PAS domain S-box-containing protein
MAETYRKKFEHPFMLGVIIAGAMICGIAIANVRISDLTLEFWLFAVLMLGLGSRIVVQIPRIKGRISVSDTFIFLGILLFGGDIGILLAGADATISSTRVTKSKYTGIFNAAVYLVSTAITVLIVTFFFGAPNELVKRPINSEYIAAICLMAVVQYVFNSGLVAIAVALRSDKPLWQMWRENFLWTSITYFAGASAAGSSAYFMSRFGFVAFLAAVPIIGIVYFTYTTYLKTVEQAAEKAELAQKHVEELSHHIAEQKRISTALREREEYFRTAFDNAAGMALVSPDGRWLEVNESLCTMLGYKEDEILNRLFHEITYPDDLGNDLANIYKLLEGATENFQLEKRYVSKTGEVVWVLQSASVICDINRNPKHIVFQIQNINDRKKAEEQIRFAAFHDSLTQLPNRTLFVDRLSMAVERAKRSAEYQFAVVFVDLDRFKIVNDSLGHDLGDRLLEDLSQRLRDCVRSIDTVARFGGDEFAVLIEGFNNTGEVIEIIDRIQSSLEKPRRRRRSELLTRRLATQDLKKFSAMPIPPCTARRQTERRVTRSSIPACTCSPSNRSQSKTKCGRHWKMARSSRIFSQSFL